MVSSGVQARGLNLLSVGAFSLYSAGLTVIPVNRDKSPAVAKLEPLFSTRPSDRDMTRWFRGVATPHGLAIVCGQVSGDIAVIDFDDEESYRLWADACPLSGTLPTVKTGRGYHVYFRAGTSLASVSKRDFVVADRPAGQLLVSRCYAVCPPTYHSDARRNYKWIIPLPSTVLDVSLVELKQLTPLEIPKADHPTRMAGLKSKTTLPLTSNNLLESSCVLCVNHPPSGSENTLGVDDALIDDAIARTLPTAYGQRHRRLFDLARELKSMPALADADPASLDWIVDRWLSRAQGVIRTQSKFESYDSFQSAWRKIRCPVGSDILAGIFAKSVDNPPSIALAQDDTIDRQIISLCHHLSLASGKGAFFLACRTISRLVGVSHTTAAKRLRGMVGRILQKVEQGSHAKRLATVYRYLPHQ